MTGADYRSYAKALFSLSEEMEKSDAVLSDFDTLVGVFGSCPEYVSLLDTPAISREEKISLLDEAFSGIDSELLSLLKMLSERRSVYTFEKIRNEFRGLYDESRGILRVEAISAVPLTEGEKARLAEKLGEGRRLVIVNNTVRPEILGGLKLRYEGVQLDGSLETRLSKLEESLKNIIV